MPDRDITDSELINLIERGILRVVLNSPIYSEYMPKENAPEYSQFAHLIGIGIGIREAARKYSVSDVTIGRWVKRGLVKRIGTDKNRVLIDEAEIAYHAEMHKKLGGKGKKIFP